MRAKHLRKGDLIGVVSPSSVVSPVERAQFDKGIRFLEGLGFRFKIAAHACIGAGEAIPSPEERASDINAMFSDSSVQAVFCSQGGDTAEECLHFIDWETIAANPKVFVGFSDITVLLDAIYAKTGLITFHGSDIVWDFGREPTQYSKREFVSRLVEGKIGLVPQFGERKTVRGGSGEGRLLGGNLRCFLKLAGTPYFPDFEDSVLFIESYETTPEKCRAQLEQMRKLGVFDKISAAVVGYVYGLRAERGKLAQMEDILLELTAGKDFPILKANDFGHEWPNTVLPVGARVRVDADAKEIGILEPCLE